MEYVGLKSYSMVTEVMDSEDDELASEQTNACHKFRDFLRWILLYYGAELTITMGQVTG